VTRKKRFVAAGERLEVRLVSRQSATRYWIEQCGRSAFAIDDLVRLSEVSRLQFVALAEIFDQDFLARLEGLERRMRLRVDLSLAIQFFEADVVADELVNVVGGRWAIWKCRGCRRSEEDTRRWETGRGLRRVVILRNEASEC